MPKLFHMIVFCFSIAGTLCCVGQNKTEPQSIIVYKTNDTINADGLATETTDVAISTQGPDFGLPNEQRSYEINPCDHYII